MHYSIRRLWPVFLLTASILMGGPSTKLNHHAANVDVPGQWTKGAHDNSDDDLTLESPAGERIVVLSAKPQGPIAAADFDVVAQTVLDARLAAVKLISGDVDSEADTTDKSKANAVNRLVRVRSKKDSSRVAVRVEVTKNKVRTTFVFGGVSRNEKDFADWSDAVLAGVQ